MDRRVAPGQGHGPRLKPGKPDTGPKRARRLTRLPTDLGLSRQVLLGGTFGRAPPAGPHLPPPARLRHPMSGNSTPPAAPAITSFAGPSHAHGLNPFPRLGQRVEPQQRRIGGDPADAPHHGRGGSNTAEMAVPHDTGSRTNTGKTRSVIPRYLVRTEWRLTINSHNRSRSAPAVDTARTSQDSAPISTRADGSASRFLHHDGRRARP